ncbi:hypothetical protein [Epilithonimonas xixisoli]|uniref:Uncharacterized protein n=1 Tax=Epilithonimonas xixisoli TaxID=1476462 RepID=A0A4R8I538_9FLAO|nr:hypothetical protein [Epilithonimonas xixisoli]TDX84003.1 hypothetical protein B0I22_1591 [Epilithonimonas xixisoli]
MLVAKITAEKASELVGQEYQSGAKFSPVQDNQGNWIVSLVEAQYMSISDIEVIEFEPLEIDESEI